MRKTILSLLSGLLISSLLSCSTGGGVTRESGNAPDSLKTETASLKAFSRDDIIIEKDLLYDQHTLADTFPYKDTVRVFQWDKIRDRLYTLDSVQQNREVWGVLQNRKNVNKEAALVREFVRNAYKRVSDMYGVERYQSIPLYPAGDSIPERYANDGALVKIINERENGDSTSIRLSVVYFGPQEWIVPDRYVKIIGDTVDYHKVIMVDRTNQNIATLEKQDGKWLVRSMNPATTGLHHPPYQMETPTGIFVVQEKKTKMYYTHDGTSSIAGYAPYASRFSNGGYIHGVPTNDPNGAMIEYSWTLGTTPRSHMCVRNATSHAKFVYDWAPVGKALVFVFD